MSAVLGGQTLRKEESEKKCYRVNITFESSEDYFAFGCLCKFSFGSKYFFKVLETNRVRR